VIRLFSKLNSKQLLLLLILCVGTVLRFYRLWDIPYTHDEFSALNRLQYTSFSDIIEYGVKVDTHPAGVQVFLYYWTKLVGESEVWVKLPFLLMGVASIFLAYLIGKKWFNKSTGLFVSALLAVMQFSVMYSQIARPYGSGLFFSLLMVYFWTNIVLSDYKVKRVALYWIAYVLSAAACAYNHHFSLLFAGIVGCTGWVIAPKKLWWQWLLAGVSMFLLYIPHLNVFMVQLNMKGIGSWLNSPTPHFFIEYLSYIFHFSWFFVLVCGVLWIWLIVSGKKVTTNKFTVISLIWFVLPMLIGYVYSVYRAPLLQFSVLIFSFPYLLFFLWGLVSEMKGWRVFFVVISLLITGSGTLIFKRHHYQLFYYSEAFKQHVVEVPEVINALGGAHQVSVFIANRPELIEYYRSKYALNFDYQQYYGYTHSLLDLHTWLKQQNSTYLVIGMLEEEAKEIVALCRQYYPYLIEKRDYVNSNLFVFSKNRSSISHQADVYYQCSFDFGRDDGAWFGYDQEKIVRGVEDYLLFSEEFGPTYQIALNPLVGHKYDVIEVKAVFDAVDSSIAQGNVTVVMEIVGDDGFQYWRGRNLFEMNVMGEENYVLVTALDCNMLPWKWGVTYTLKTFLWNQDNSLLKLKEFSWVLRQGNYLKYAIWEDF
jgi:hypothetical protein